MRLRSPLFAPGDSERKMHKAIASAADAVILDLGLPKMDGVRVLEKWRKDGRTMPVLILTARDRWSDKVAGFDAKAPPPKTSAFWAIVDASRAPEEAELADALDRLGNPDATTIDQLSGGRLEIGVGSGGPRRPFAAFGMSADRWLPRFTEGLALMKALWTEPLVTFDGEFWQLKDAAMEPKPYQKPYPRLWFGGSAATAVRRGVGLCDGFFGAGSSATSAFASQVAVVRSTLAEDFGGRSVGFGSIATATLCLEVACLPSGCLERNVRS